MIRATSKYQEKWTMKKTKQMKEKKLKVELMMKQEEEIKRSSIA